MTSDLLHMAGVLLETAQNNPTNYYKLAVGCDIAIVAHEGKYYVCTIRDGHLSAAGKHDSYMLAQRSTIHMLAQRSTIHMLVGIINQQVGAK